MALRASAHHNARPVRHPIRSALVALVVLAVLDQVVHYSVLSDGRLRGRRIAPYDPPIFCEAQQQAFERYREHAETGRPRATEFEFDAQLGWAPIPGRAAGPRHHDWSGSRRGPEELAREKAPERERLVTIGCSFTMGEEVADDETWPYALDVARGDVEVANLAMGAYGLDQALLRLRRDGRPLMPDRVWLGWLPAASLRVGTTYRPAERHWSGTALFKPRFRVDDAGALTLVGNPARSVAHTARLLSNQPEFYQATWKTDLWVERSERAYRTKGTSLLHHSALTRLALSVHERRDRDPAAWILDEESEIHRLIDALVRETRREASGMNAAFALVVLPGREDLADRAERGVAYWRAITDELVADGVRVLDLTDALVAAGALDDDSYWMPGGHYSPKANALVARELAKEWEEAP